MPEGQAQAARAVLYNYFTYRGGDTYINLRAPAVTVA